MTLDDDDDRLVLIAAMRYALGRMTYMPSVIAGKIRQCWYAQEWAPIEEAI